MDPRYQSYWIPPNTPWHFREPRKRRRDRPITPRDIMEAELEWDRYQQYKKEKEASQKKGDKPSAPSPAETIGKFVQTVAVLSFLGLPFGFLWLWMMGKILKEISGTF